ncbi:hypothetical protein OIO90_002723 [Microbotryomycetes sp. JL221]|nr:hypothetical protein OIO90_002723 [Microbotryomycetes sp. JL221]
MRRSYSQEPKRIDHYIPGDRSSSSRSSFNASPRARPVSSTSINMDSYDRKKSISTRNDALPLHSRSKSMGSIGNGPTISIWRIIMGKTKSGNKLRIVLITSIILSLVLWSYQSPKSPVVIEPGSDKLNNEMVSSKSAIAKQWNNIPKVVKPVDVHVENDEKQPSNPKKPQPPPPLAETAQDQTQSLPPRIESKPVDVDVRDSTNPTTTSTTGDDNVKYLAYLPHSGYHNQRISLENALTLAYALDRTLIVPPVWLGQAIPYISFDKLNRRLEIASKVGLDRCKEFGEGGSEDPIPRECQGFWSWTQVGWNFLVNLDSVQNLVPILNRWNMSDGWLVDQLNLRQVKKGHESPDAFYLKDDRLYQYRFYDTEDDNEPLAKFETRIDIDKLAKETRDYKLVHVGSMFGTSRLRPIKDDVFEARSAFRKAMVFQNPVVDKIATTIRDRLGGSGNYYGLHLRVGDGVFQTNARKNVLDIWNTLCMKKMGLEQSVCDQMREASSDKRRSAQSKRSLDELQQQRTKLVKRGNARPQRKGALHHDALPALPMIESLDDSLLDPSITCRGSLHTDQSLVAFNTPLFLATDSKNPTNDINLKIFFNSFPCTFTLGDFSSLNLLNNQVVSELSQLNLLRNKEDKVPLAQFLYPQLDAQIAAWGRGLIGTPQSTFSRFAVDVLHQSYHGWDIIERG